MWVYKVSFSLVDKGTEKESNILESEIESVKGLY